MSAIMSQYPTAASTTWSARGEIAGVHLRQSGEVLEVALVGGGTFSLSAELLWRECPSAQGKMRRISGRLSSPPPDLRIVALHEIGRYAVNIVFSDGHDRGIYPWSYLLALGRLPQIEDFIAAEQVS